ncbi:MAG: phosphoribosylformylglycinamidine synthase subunit PurL, partial [Planctomycetota bacterium]
SLPDPFTSAQKYEFDLQEVKLDGLSDEELDEVSRTGQLSLSRREMQTIRDHFQSLGRAPTDIELETIAQTWSEHCCHKTLTAKIAHERPGGETLRFENLLKETIGRATNELMAKETEEFCLSVFVDNAGVVAFDDEYGLSFKVETHNHPSAIEPYGGAGTGIGGVLRDTLGTGLGAKPIVNTDVFCVGPIDTPKDEVPPGVLHPKRVLRGIVGGVRDYGNRMGIPTASGALYFDERYTTNPLVFCGSVGLIPRDAVEKDVQPGDRVVVMGGRTGRDGIHGATFSSIELSEESETVSSGAVQIGNAITEKKCLDVLLEARDRRLFRGVTDCGAGGLSSAVGEMGEKCGARVDLDTVPLKYEGLNYWEIWISEAQERMVFAVPPECKDELFALAASEDVECTDLGEFTDTGRLELFSHGERVADLSMAFLHDGRPVWTRESRFEPRASAAPNLDGLPAAGKILHSILAAPNVASKEWVVRQYDHEVQGRSVLKPFQGPGEGPGDGVAFTPRLDSRRGVVIGCGMNPCYGDLDPYRMALSAIDESMRNVVAAGGDPDHTAILDNFCWGNTDRPETLGTIVEAAIGCRDGALALGTPFISGKDSLNNEYRVGDEVLSIPSTLLISSMSIVPDVRRLVSMDAKKAGNKILLVGETKAELGGSHLLRVSERDGGEVPDLPSYALDTHRAMHAAVKEGLVQSIHDLSEGGLAVAGAEMAFSGGVGIELRLDGVPRPADLSDDLTILFSESNSRYLVEVCPEDVEALCSKLGELPFAEVGETIEYGIFRVVGLSGETTIAEPLAGLADSWRTPIIDQPEPTNAVS